MVSRLPYPDKEHEDPRQEYLDGPLEVAAWPLPGVSERQRSDVPDEAPAWWQGDVEASQSFLRAMGVDPATLEGGER